MKALIVTFAFIVGFAAAARAQSGGIEVTAAWARATAAAAGVVYLTIANAGSTSDRLTEASTPAAGSATMHISLLEGGVAEMRPVDAVDLPPGERVVFKPGGLHIMLMQLKGPLVAGAQFPLTLAFERAGRIEVEVQVLPAGANGYP